MSSRGGRAAAAAAAAAHRGKTLDGTELPFRFGVEMGDVLSLADGQARHSVEEFYAGSLWKVSVQGAFYTLVPIRPRWRGERRSLRTFPGASLRPHLAFNTRPRRLPTPTDAFQLHPVLQRPSLLGRGPEGSKDARPVSASPAGERPAHSALARVVQPERGGLRADARDGDDGRRRRRRLPVAAARAERRRRAVVVAVVVGREPRAAAGVRCVLYKRFSPIDRFQHLIASLFN